MFRKQAGDSIRYTGVRCGSVTFVQSFGSALNLNPHFHVLMLDGVYASAEDGDAPVFVPAPALIDADVQQIVETDANRIVRLLQRRGILDDAQVVGLGHLHPVVGGIAVELCSSPRYMYWV